jgi:hypothetical protein
MEKRLQDKVEKLLAKLFAAEGVFEEGFVVTIKPKPLFKRRFDRPNRKVSLKDSPVALLKDYETSPNIITLTRFFSGNLQIKTLGDLLNQTDQDLDRLRLFGDRTFNLINIWLATLGPDLKMKPSKYRKHTRSRFSSPSKES